jgi:hypothetical protein
MFSSWSKARHVNKSLCLIVASHDNHTVNAEHWQQQGRHTYIIYPPPHAPCAWFGMQAMFRATAAKV